MQVLLWISFVKYTFLHIFIQNQNNSAVFKESQKLILKNNRICRDKNCRFFGVTSGISPSGSFVTCGLKAKVFLSLKN